MQLYHTAGNICFKSKLSLTGTLENAIISQMPIEGEVREPGGE